MHRIGDVVTIPHVPGGYPLPGGLPEGAQVRIVRVVDAYRIVERDGRELQVFIANIERKE